tara:strand:+ start:121 stop:537 length:417 start_codon:yes stop_codon:yes gene_type:complete
MSNRIDFSDRIVIDKSKINGKINGKINVGDYIKVDENNNNFPNKWIITNKKNATNIILCEDADNDGTKVIIQSINGSIKRHDNIHKNKKINDNITINNKSSIIVYKNKKYFLYETNIDRLLEYYKSINKNIGIYLLDK